MSAFIFPDPEHQRKFEALARFVPRLWPLKGWSPELLRDIEERAAVLAEVTGIAQADCLAAWLACRMAGARLSHDPSEFGFVSTASGVRVVYGGATCIDEGAASCYAVPATPELLEHLEGTTP